MVERHVLHEQVTISLRNRSNIGFTIGSLGALISIGLVTDQVVVAAWAIVSGIFSVAAAISGVKYSKKVEVTE